MIKKCVMCNRKFECYHEKHHGSIHQRTTKRGFKMKTCSPKCARDWSYYIRTKEYKQKLKKK